MIYEYSTVLMIIGVTCAISMILFNLLWLGSFLAKILKTRAAIKRLAETGNDKNGVEKVSQQMRKLLVRMDSRASQVKLMRFVLPEQNYDIRKFVKSRRSFVDKEHTKEYFENIKKGYQEKRRFTTEDLNAEGNMTDNASDDFNEKIPVFAKKGEIDMAKWVRTNMDQKKKED